jgi:acetylornithine deacetylase/succinyl-diaminopimelate desuccinylase-like protein
MSSSEYASEIDLARALIQARSPSGRESPAASVLRDALSALGADEAVIDEAGNAIGTFFRGDGPLIMLNGHLDTVPVGEHSLWPHPPLSGALADGELWGRGACDMKSALACMAFAAGDAVNAGFRGTLVVSGVVQEEWGGFGARHLARGMDRCDLVLLGEPSNLALMLGHRGRIQIQARLPGRIAHAARSQLGENALYHAADFLQQLRRLELPSGGPLGGSSLTPTQLITFPEGGANVVPGRADLTIDYRNIVGDEPDQVLARLRALAPRAEMVIPQRESCSEDGQLSESRPCIVEPYLVPGDHPLAQRAAQILEPLLAGQGMPLEQGHWWFGTDAPELATAGAVVLGFGPGDPELAHTTNERVPLTQLDLARRGYTELVLKLGT